MVDEYKTLIVSLQDKVKRIASAYEHTRSKYEELKREQRKLVVELNEKDTNIRNLKGQIEKLKIVTSIKASAEDVGDAKQKIDTIVREIDKCIALLKKQF